MSKRKDPPSHRSDSESTLGVEETFRDYFLQYASYVITDRAIPDIEDGLKPVQRRILHSMWENEDGRYNKVANLVGHSMKYHPHGDASIYSAMVGIGQKRLLIDTQGNWGDPVTNDAPAAARYIEARLTPFAKEVVFAPHLTKFKKSYDGRNNEPITLPVRFPLLLAQGAEGIAVGLSTKILPHNFIELLEAQKAYLRGEEFSLFPDFQTGGLIEVKDYQEGAFGSRVKVRAVTERGSGKTIIIRQIPYGTTTEGLIDSILKASDKGKIKVANIQDNSAADIEIVVSFQRGVDMDKAEDALFAFTDCEVSLASNCTVIKDGHPIMSSVSEILSENTERTRALLKLDLEIELDRLETQWHLKSLVQIFIENRIYLRIEKCETWVDVLYEIDKGLEPHLSNLRRPVTEDDLVYLTEVKIRRISAWDSQKAKEELLKIDEEIKRVKKDLRNLTNYTIQFIDHLIEKYGKGQERKTKITNFEAVEAVTVVERTEKLYVEPRAGFIGTDLKDAPEIGPCSLLDDVLVVLEDGGLFVVRVADRRYVGENIVHSEVFNLESREKTFNMVYEDQKSGRSYAKRFQVGGYTRDRRYELGSSDKTRVLLFTDGEAGIHAHVKLRKKPRIKTDIYVRFDDILVKGRGANGITVSKHKVSSARLISETVYRNRTGEESAPADEEPEQDSSQIEEEEESSNNVTPISDRTAAPKSQRSLFSPDEET
ncbi:MAG: DNA gyrase/topoisomerase IV subunit A [Acidobacteriota bacterium]|nr:MAG: DNA gyrase/topoisomerase IV subunit A [Acidobacteriota bacterium]